jgi:LPXTG-motif cell wall-anchored protein
MVMFKRAKKAGGGPAGQPAKIGAAAAGVGGLLGGLLFWRKRKH